jgi:antitoxin component YwqK of YwqJK toxin-antitoxin module
MLFSLDSQAQTEYVARSWSNGNPMVVYYLTTGTSNIEKEQVFYENGNLDYEGEYLDGVEHGYWTYYWENGQMKSQEFYVNGLEEGTMFDYDKNGEKSIKYVYSNGILMSKTVLSTP